MSGSRETLYNYVKYRSTFHTYIMVCVAIADIYQNRCLRATGQFIESVILLYRLLISFPSTNYRYINKTCLAERALSPHQLFVFR